MESIAAERLHKIGKQNPQLPPGAVWLGMGRQHGLISPRQGFLRKDQALTGVP